MWRYALPPEEVRATRTKVAENARSCGTRDAAETSAGGRGGLVTRAARAASAQWAGP